ncbi:MAG: aminoglycoside phosphotransferase family protein [Burkholderiales bacterium]
MAQFPSQGNEALSTSDPRLEALRLWTSACLDEREILLERASEDASFRRYFRVRAHERTWIVMDAPPEREDCNPFVKVAALMHEAGVHVPQVVAQDLARGFLLLSDLGTQTYLRALNESNADALFSDAIDALIKWQLASRPDVLPPYDEALLKRELELFPEWYVQRHLGVALDETQRAALDGIFARVLESALAQPKVYVHRDYMPRNLMVSEPNPGVLDFQDAVYGPITYDVVSLFRDAFLSWPEARVLDWTVRYWERARKAGLPLDPDFATYYRAFEWMGMQRHFKVLGIFARIRYRDGKAGYLEDTPRFLAYVRAAASRYSELSAVNRLLDALEERAPRAAYTF